MLKGAVLNFETRMKFDHHANIPNEFRMLILGKSGSGKTCQLFRMLCEPNFLDYQHLLLFAPSQTLKQQEFQLLYHGLTNGLTKETITAMVLNQDKLKEEFPNISVAELCRVMAKIKNETNGITVKMTDKFNEIPDPSVLNRDVKNLIIFEDCKSLKEMHYVIRNYFTRGRISSCNVIFLSQGYFGLPNDDIRENANFLIIFKHEKRKIGNIYDSIGSDRMGKPQFISFAQNSWVRDNGHGYIVVNLVNGKVYNDVFEEEPESDDD